VSANGVDMPEIIEIKVTVDESLVIYFENGMRRRHIDCSVTEELTEFLALILNDTMYPIASRNNGEQNIHLSYRPKSFADPIFLSDIVN